MTGMVGGLAGGREEKGLEAQGAFTSPRPGTPSPCRCPSGALTNVLGKAQEGFLVQGVHKDAAHEGVQSGLLGLGVPQPCQET